MPCDFPPRHQTIELPICDFIDLHVNDIKCIRLPSPNRDRPICVSHLPDSYVCCRVREGSFKHATHLEGIRVNFCDVVQYHQDSSQRVYTGEQTNVTKQQEQLQVVIKCTLREHTHKLRHNSHFSPVLNKKNEDSKIFYPHLSERTSCTYQVCAHVGLQSDLLSQGKLYVLQSSSLLDFADHLLVASPLEPVRQEGLHELIQDLTGNQQGG